MEITDTVYQEIEQNMLSHGLTIAQLIQQCARHNSPLLNLSDESRQKYCELYDQIKSGEYNKQEKGQKLEQLVSILFEKESLFECRKNCRTSTNEIDLLLSWSIQAREAGIAAAFPCFGDTFICECKNYEKKLGVTYVGKFSSLLDTTDLKFGLIVTWEGITGNGQWSHSKGLVKKIALRDQRYIVSLDKNDLKAIYNNEKNVYSIMLDKYNSLRHDIDYKKYVSHHEAEVEFSS